MRGSVAIGVAKNITGADKVRNRLTRALECSVLFALFNPAW